MAGQRGIEKSQTPHFSSPRAPKLTPEREGPLELDPTWTCDHATAYAA